MAEHTPGPWRRLGTNGEFIEAEPLGPQGPIVEVAYCQDGEPDALAANAALIAAAPTLLEELVDIADLAEGKRASGESLAVRLSIIAAKARAAIAKAQGRAS